MMEEYHSRWDRDHTSICQDCYEDWLDACTEMEADAKLDALIEQEEIE